MSYRFSQTLIALDQVVNTLFSFGGDGYGYADETISARAWRLREKSRADVWIDRLFFWQTGHCETAYRNELLQKHLPKSYRALSAADADADADADAQR
jgi:hypothetical protein